MNDGEKVSEAIDDLRKRVRVLEDRHIVVTETAPEATDVRHEEENSQPGQ